LGRLAVRFAGRAGIDPAVRRRGARAGPGAARSRVRAAAGAGGRRRLPALRSRPSGVSRRGSRRARRGVDRARHARRRAGGDCSREMKFARLVDGRVTPDPRHVWLEGGFARGRLYRLAYTATGAQVVGLGLVALRDCAAWLKGAEAPAQARWVYAYGRSQTGRLLRTLIHYGLNADERGGEALDGVIANVAG